jgi:hypothetical protein
LVSTSPGSNATTAALSGPLEETEGSACSAASPQRRDWI